MELPPLDISVEDIFPNDSDLSLSFLFGSMKLDRNWANRFLPPYLFSSCGSKIKEIKLPTPDPDILPVLQKTFPNIEKLELLEDSGRFLREILLKLPKSWPELESLTIPVHYWRPDILDWDFLGLSEHDVLQLEDPTRRSENFTQAEIQEFKDRCCIRKLKGLKKLKIVLSKSLVKFESKSGKNVMGFTPISNQFGFSLLEGLEVSVSICRRDGYFEGIMKELAPLARSGSIVIVERIR